MSDALLILEDKTVFRGHGIGALKDVICELVFNSSLTGYQEALTDPSYFGQGLILTFPLIGNYGVNNEDYESRDIFTSALIVRELSRYYSNFRGEDTLLSFLIKHDIPGIEGIDTRELVKILRDKGSMRAMISFDENCDIDEAVEKIKGMRPEGLVERVSVKEPLVIGETGNRTVAILDFGCKDSISKSLASRGFKVKIHPWDTRAEEILKDRPDGIVLPNGPGNPKDCKNALESIKKLYDTDIPILAISLGHQLLALATGADTKRLACGHHGSNYPVKDLKTNRVYITSQNHSFVVDEKTINPKVAAVSHVNINDNTVEGLSYVGKRIISVQFSPEASHGPIDTSFLFDDFIKTIGG